MSVEAANTGTAPPAEELLGAVRREADAHDEAQDEQSSIESSHMSSPVGGVN
jgi:hypothetical protein